MEKITFKVQSFRRLPNPYLEVTEDAPQMYMALCDVTELPDNFPMDTNPREQNLNTSVAKRIRESLKNEAEKDFFLLNRGILLSSKEVKYENSKGELTIFFEDNDVHGNVDGGHTYAIIKDLQNKTTPGTQFVKLEILTGVEDIFTKLSSARNSSVQVTPQTIAEQEKRFELIKTALQKDSSGIAKRISFKQNDNEGDIEISEILAILNLFNLAEYSNRQNDNYPTQSYSGKAKCTERYINTHKKHGESIENPYVKMTTIMTDIFKLYNKLETTIGDYYADGGTNRRYGRVKGVSGNANEGKFTSKFYGQKMDYSTPTGFIYPILGAFRSLVSENDSGYYKWTIDPFVTMDQLGKELVSITVNRNSSLGYNPHSVGKDKEHWRTLYIMVKMHLMEQLM